MIGWLCTQQHVSFDRLRQEFLKMEAQMKLAALKAQRLVTVDTLIADRKLSAGGLEEIEQRALAAYAETKKVDPSSLDIPMMKKFYMRFLSILFVSLFAMLPQGREGR
jgi:hypothetical protein